MAQAAELLNDSPSRPPFDRPVLRLVVGLEQPETSHEQIEPTEPVELSLVPDLPDVPPITDELGSVPVRKAERVQALSDSFATSESTGGVRVKRRGGSGSWLFKGGACSNCATSRSEFSFGGSGGCANCAGHGGASTAPPVAHAA